MWFIYLYILNGYNAWNTGVLSWLWGQYLGTLNLNYHAAWLVTLEKNCLISEKNYWQPGILLSVTTVTFKVSTTQNYNCDLCIFSISFFPLFLLPVCHISLTKRQAAVFFLFVQQTFLHIFSILHVWTLPSRAAYTNQNTKIC